MEVKILSEHGYDHALRGMAYSFKDRAENVDVWWPTKYERAKERSVKLAQMDGGHNKFLESITVWIDIEASRAFWSEFDTYRVGTTKQSESTMHTLAKREPDYSDFEEGTHPALINAFIQVWRFSKGDITSLKENLPEGFLQRRVVVTNYKTLRNIIQQRRDHRYKRWDTFINKIMQQLEHKELISE